MNRRINSDSNLHRFNLNGGNCDEKKLSSFLPDFLVNKLTNDDSNARQHLFLEDGNDDDALEIKMDSYIINDKHNVRIILIIR